MRSRASASTAVSSSCKTSRAWRHDASPLGAVARLMPNDGVETRLAKRARGTHLRPPVDAVEAEDVFGRRGAPLGGAIVVSAEHRGHARDVQTDGTRRRVGFVVIAVVTIFPEVHRGLIRRRSPRMSLVPLTPDVFHEIPDEEVGSLARGWCTVLRVHVGTGRGRNREEPGRCHGCRARPPVDAPGVWRSGCPVSEFLFGRARWK